MMNARTTNSDRVSTCLGALHVGRFGAGPPTVLWHSLWVDSRSWGPLVDAFAAHRQVLTIDGPGYGLSSPIDRDFTLDDCVRAACEVLDQLGITEPVDWVGNAWGGHVGITLAAAQPHRLRSLVTIAAPVTPVGRTQRLTQTYPLALLYRLLGPNRVLAKVLFDVLLGSDAIAAQPDRAAEMMAAFRAADKESMRRTIRFMHNWRPLTDKLPAVTVPTVLITGDLDGQHWGPADAQAAAEAMPAARAVAVTASGHVGPLLVDVDQIASTVVDFWKAIP
jgi:pimeloyl-ACP methyl ester carboxylesterase